MLKNRYEMTHGEAYRVGLTARGTSSASIVAAAKAAGHDQVGVLYSSKKAGLMPLHEMVMAALTAFGNDIVLAP